MPDAGHVLEELGDLAGLPGELGFVMEVLVLAAAAFAEERTAWLGTLGRGFDDFEQIGAGVVLVVAVDAGADFFTGEAEGNEDDPGCGFAVGVLSRGNGDAGEAVAEIGEGLDDEFEFLVVGEGMGVELFRRSGHGESGNGAGTGAKWQIGGL